MQYIPGFVVYLVTKTWCVDNCERNSRSILIEFKLCNTC